MKACFCFRIKNKVTVTLFLTILFNIFLTISFSFFYDVETGFHSMKKGYILVQYVQL